MIYQSVGSKKADISAVYDNHGLSTAWSVLLCTEVGVCNSVLTRDLHTMQLCEVEGCCLIRRLDYKTLPSSQLHNQTTARQSITVSARPFQLLSHIEFHHRFTI